MKKRQKVAGSPDSTRHTNNLELFRTCLQRRRAVCSHSCLHRRGALSYSLSLSKAIYHGRVGPGDLGGLRHHILSKFRIYHVAMLDLLGNTGWLSTICSLNKPRGKGKKKKKKRLVLRLHLLWPHLSCTSVISRPCDRQGRRGWTSYSVS